MRKIFLVFISLALVLSLSPTPFAQSILVEDIETVSDAQPRWLLNSLTLHPRLWRDTADSTNRFLKFTMKIQYQGPDYDFSELLANNVAGLVCDFGVNMRTGDSIYSIQENFVYAGALPLVNNQELTTDILVKLPVRHKKLLKKNNNFCSVDLNNVIDGGDLAAAELDAIMDGVTRDSAPFKYKVKMVRNILRLNPR